MQPDDARILDILFAAADVADYIRGKSYPDYVNTSLLRAGVERQVYIIGEACRQISAKFKTAHPAIPWSQIIGARNILAHEYGQVKHEILWEIANMHVPALAESLKPFAPHEVE